MRKLSVVFALLLATKCFALDITEPDKAMHALSGALIAKYCKSDFKMNTQYTLITVSSISCVKEYLDTFKDGGYFDEQDIYAALIGAMVVCSIDDTVELKVTREGFSFKVKIGATL